MVGRPLLVAALSVAQRVFPRIAGRLPVGGSRLGAPSPTAPSPDAPLPAISPTEGPASPRRAELAPMRPVRPSAAGNDNPLGALRTEVERDLRAHGYIR